MRMFHSYRLLLILAVLMSGCAGINSYPTSLRAGETATLAAGWKHSFTRDSVTVTITPSGGAPIVIPAGDPAIRAVINWYPDPVSWLVVGTETGQSNNYYSAGTYGNIINNNFTNGDRDWWQTMVFVDIPASVTPGTALVELSSSAGETYSANMQVLPGTGSPEGFEAEFAEQLSQQQLTTLGRADHFVVSLDGATLPYGVQVDLQHDPDAASGGAGKVHVINPRGDIKSLAWYDDGVNLRVFMLPSRTSGMKNIKDFKFYVSGGITGLIPGAVEAYDVNGDPVAGVSATVTPGG